ncbi:GxxExxY protein [Mesoterricola sediminis]|uniref:GxxExxY protein n=1 Tax=Mesoterricola sediminis TaxID=2927980 RepID=UPI00293070C0|nr:GxxExxY protein [Mesoterricola sediminis]
MKRGGAEDLAEGRGGKRSWNLPLDIEWRGLVVERAYRLDLLVDDLVVVEAKAVEKLMDAHFAQLNTQLRFSGMEVGLLLNFHQWPFKDGGIKRVIHPRA